MSQPKQLALVDGHALAFRAFYALSDSALRSSKSEPTYAVFGFAQILLTTLQERRPDYVAVAFDIGSTFRDDMYAEYKAGRVEPPEEFGPQLERIKQLVQALNIPIYTAEGYEADDVIGTLARQATEQGVATIILTGDTDTLQLVDERVNVLLANPYGQRTSTTLYDLEKVRERYKGLAPGQLADLRGLKGDASDNIPGVKGIGETGAINLLNQFGNVEQVYAQMENVPKRYRKPLEGQLDSALLSKKLATIVCDVPLRLDLSAATLHDYDRSAIIGLFQELEFGSSLVKKLPSVAAPVTASSTPAPNSPHQQHMFETEALPKAAAEAESPSVFTGQLSMFDEAVTAGGDAAAQLGDYRAVVTEEALHDVAAALDAAPAFAFDTESTGLRPFHNDIVGISLAVRPGEAWYIPLGHREGRQLPRQQVLDALRPFLADPNRPKYAHHAKFDIEVLQHAGVETRGVAFDTMIAAGLLGRRQGLKDLAFYELKIAEPMTPIEDLIGKGARQITFDQTSIERATPYASADADMTLRLKPALEQQLSAQHPLDDLFMRLEMPLIPVLAEMERAGIGLDVPYITALGEQLGARLADLEAQIHAFAEQPFNINSSDQLSDVLFGKLGLPTEGVSRTAKTKKYSLTADTLERMRGLHPIIDRILEYRQLAKLKSTYVDALPALINPETGRIHTSYNQLGAATGRLSSNDPNLQNIPVRTEEGRSIRRAFVATPGSVFIAADYSQIELRVLAHITQDENLIQAFTEGQDIHAATAAQLFGVPIADVDKSQRRIAKTTVFGIIYGISSFGLAQRTELSRSEAQALIDAVFARFPRLRTYIDATLEQGRRDGYVRSLFGRRRKISDLNASGARRQAAEREAINAPIQSTAADIMKLAMIRMFDALQQHKLRTRMLLQVHDELIFEAPREETAEVQALVRSVMEGVYPDLRAPLSVDMETGANWGEMESTD